MRGRTIRSPNTFGHLHTLGLRHLCICTWQSWSSGTLFIPCIQAHSPWVYKFSPLAEFPEQKKDSPYQNSEICKDILGENTTPIARDPGHKAYTKY
jgi:hypothetical protein